VAKRNDYGEYVVRLNPVVGTFWLHGALNRVVEIVDFVDDDDESICVYWRVRDILSGWEARIAGRNLDHQLTPLEVLAWASYD